MAKKTAEDFKLHTPSYVKEKEDTVMSFDRFDHRARLYKVEDHIILTDTSIEVLVSEINSNRRKIAELGARLTDLAKR